MTHLNGVALHQGHYQHTQEELIHLVSHLLGLLVHLMNVLDGLLLEGYEVVVVGEGLVEVVVHLLEYLCQ